MPTATQFITTAVAFFAAGVYQIVASLRAYRRPAYHRESRRIFVTSMTFIIVTLIGIWVVPLVAAALFGRK